MAGPADEPKSKPHLARFAEALASIVEVETGVIELRFDKGRLVTIYRHNKFTPAQLERWDEQAGWLVEATVNTGKAGKTYPVKFQLKDSTGNFVSSLSAVTAIGWNPTTCGSWGGDPTDPLETTTTGATSLRYDSAANQYVYNWATPKAGCYTFFVKLNDGTINSAFFNLS